MECDKAQADAIIVPHHFSHKVTKNSCLNLLVFYKDKIRGAMQIGYGIRPHIKTDKGEVLDYHQVREFDRMWLSDDMPKFSETICLSLLHKYIRATHKEIKYLISYADTSIGNKGTIYKAANYEHIDTIKAEGFDSDFCINQGNMLALDICDTWYAFSKAGWEKHKNDEV